MILNDYPKGWQKVKLGDCCEIISGATPSRDVPEYWGGSIHWVTPKDLSKLDGPVLGEAPEKITEIGYRGCSTTIMPKGTVLFSSRAPIGLVAIAGRPMCTNQGFKSVVPGPDVVSEYLYWCLRWLAPEISKQGTGTTFKEIAKPIMERVEIPLPPTKDEQRRIAAILDKADAIRRKRQESIRLTEEFIRSTFLEMFGDPEGHNWPMNKIVDVAHSESGSIRTGPFGSQLLHSEFVDEGIAVLGIDNAVENEFRWSERRFITESKYNELSRYTVKPGDILITIMGTCGRCAIVPDDISVAINTKHLCCITLDLSKCLPTYVHAYFLQHKIARHYLESTAKGAIMDGLNMGIIKEMPIPIPPIDLQQKFSCTIANIQNIRDKKRLASIEQDALFNSLTHRAFRGEL